MKDTDVALWWVILLTGMGITLWLVVIALILVVIAYKTHDWRE